MLGLKKLFGKQSPIKAVVGNSFLENLNKINNEVAKVRDDVVKPKSDKYDYFCEEGFYCLKLFSSDPENHKNELNSAILNLSKAIEIKRTKPEPYFYLSYIACLYKDISLAIKYYNLVLSLDPKLNGLDKLKAKIDSLLTIDKSVPSINKPKVLTSSLSKNTYKSPLKK